MKKLIRKIYFTIKNKFSRNKTMEWNCEVHDNDDMDYETYSTTMSFVMNEKGEYQKVK